MKRGNVVFNDFFFRGFNPQQWWKTCLNQSFDPISQNAVFFFISVQHQRGSHLVSFFYSSTKICNVQIVGWGSTSISQGAPANLSYFPTRPHWGWAHCGPHRPPNTSQIPPTCKCFPNQTHPDLGGSASWSSWLFAHLARRSPRTEKEEDANQKPLTAMKLISRRITTIIIQSPPSSSNHHNHHSITTIIKI